MYRLVYDNLAAAPTQVAAEAYSSRVISELVILRVVTVLGHADPCGVTEAAPVFGSDRFVLVSGGATSARFMASGLTGQSP